MDFYLEGEGLWERKERVDEKSEREKTQKMEGEKRLRMMREEEKEKFIVYTSMLWHVPKNAESYSLFLCTHSARFSGHLVVLSPDLFISWAVLKYYSYFCNIPEVWSKDIDR